MLHATVDDHDIAAVEGPRIAANGHLEFALEHVEEVVCVRMAVPDELALDFDYLDLVVVDRCDDARGEALVEQGEFLREI